MKYTSQQQKALAVGLAARNYHKQLLALVCCGRDSTQQSLTRLPSVGGRWQSPLHSASQKRGPRAPRRASRTSRLLYMAIYLRG